MVDVFVSGRETQWSNNHRPSQSNQLLSNSIRVLALAVALATMVEKSVTTFMSPHLREHYVINEASPARDGKKINAFKFMASHRQKQELHLHISK